MPGTQLVNPLTAARDHDDSLRLSARFPELQTCGTTTFLVLRPYLYNCPERFFSQPIHTLMLDWLRNRDSQQRVQLRRYFTESISEISAAMLFLRQINSEDWHDRSLIQGDDYEIVRFIDTVLHPAYLRLSEGVLAPLLRPVAHFSRLDRNRGTENLDIFQIFEELARGRMGACVRAYDNTIRNGIGHGGITYLQNSLRYYGKRGEPVVLDVWSVVRLCDDMVDACNAIASALKLFFITSCSAGYSMPHEQLVEELMEGTRSPWWRISGCIESEIPGATQLLVYAHPHSRDTLKVFWSAAYSAALAETLAPGYDRYFISLRSPKGWPGWASFEGPGLRSQRLSGATEVHEYASALSDSGFLYVPTPRIPRLLSQMITLLQSFRLHWPRARQQILEHLGIPRILGREAKMHRNAWGYVLRGGVVIPQLDPLTAASVIRSNRRRIIRVAARVARSEESLLSLTRYLPLGCARINVFTNDFRRRRLSGFGLGPELVCTVQLQRIRRIRSPDIMDSEIEARGKWRIAWNRAWLESGGQI